MENLNIVNPVIESQLWEQQTDNSKKLVSSDITKYEDYGNGRFYPTKFYTLKTTKQLTSAQFGNETPEMTTQNYLFVDINKYKLNADKLYTPFAYLASVTLPGNQVTSYAWDVFARAPSMKAVNAAFDEAFTTSFEYDEGAAIGSGHTGKYYWNGDFVMEFLLPNAKTYKISYWYRQNGNWIFSGELNYTYGVSLNLGDAIDDVRIYPEGALLSTYTYNPLGGMTSATDENNLTTHYQYDQLHRLKLVKDQSGNILKTHTYHYKQ